MPVKRRKGKRRLDPAAEVKAWTVAFESGFDFFGDPREHGIGDDVGPEFRRAAAEAWRRLGADFRASWQPDGAILTPWALKQFGEPRGARQCH